MNFNIFISTFLRSFFLESLWNYERMQNVGFTFTIIPFLKSLYKDKIKLAERIKAHFGFFNTHPYLANLLIGIVMRKEEEYSKGLIDSGEVIKTKTMLGGPVAAIGDRLIWSTWRVFCGMLVLSYLFLFGKGFYLKVNIWFVVLFFLLVYNLVGHLPFRFFGIYLGYHYSKDIIQKLAKFELQKIVKNIRNVGVIILLISSFVYSVSLKETKLILIFWFNILLSLFMGRKHAEIVIFYAIFIINFLIIIVLK
ncbi:MAG: PTS system mannose/fructose/sorbose family transporter subunit IID [Endomicrobia bacterium]|nr:PTS system mannose/fructose/sorbose family transporter subunit IID [Endomicrobiia bacterium]